MAKRCGRPDGVRSGLDQLAIALGQRLRPLDRVDDGAVRDGALERMEPELEHRDDPEVRAGTAQAPEELRLLLFARADEAAVGGHELRREWVVDRQAEPALQPAHAAAERQAADAGVRDDADRADEPVLLRRLVEFAEQRTAAHARGTRLRIDAGSPEETEVEDHAVVASGEPRDAVTAAPHRDHELALPRKADRSGDVVAARRPHDQRRPAVDHAVPDPARRVVVGVAGAHDLARESLRQPAKIPHPSAPSARYPPYQGAPIPGCSV
jgi:hypothetical protein